MEHSLDPSDEDTELLSSSSIPLLEANWYDVMNRPGSWGVLKEGEGFSTPSNENNSRESRESNTYTDDSISGSSNRNRSSLKKLSSTTAMLQFHDSYLTHSPSPLLRQRRRMDNSPGGGLGKENVDSEGDEGKANKAVVGGLSPLANRISNLEKMFVDSEQMKRSLKGSSQLEKVNAGRVGVGNVSHSIGKNLNPSQIKFTTKSFSD